MIGYVEAVNFRSLREIQISLGQFQVLIGPNASGKSTFLDVIAFLADVVRERDGVVAAVAARAPDLRDLCWLRQGEEFELALEAPIPEPLQRDDSCSHLRYEMRIGRHPETGATALLAETFFLKPPPDPRRSYPVVQPPIRKRYPKDWRPVVKKILDSGSDHFRAETSDWNVSFRLGPARSALANLPEDPEKFPVAVWFRQLLIDGVQRLMLNSAALRLPSPPVRSRRFLPDGSNLPWVIKDLREQAPERFQDWLAHLRTALPDLQSLRVVERPEDRHCYLVVEYANGLSAPSWLVSDGTLRLLALTILAYLPNLSGIYLIEEPENGIHPRAIETVLQSLASVYDAQVLLATHSPIVLGLTRPADLLCFSRGESGESRVMPGTEHPSLLDWQNEIDLGTLFAEGKPNKGGRYVYK